MRLAFRRAENLPRLAWCAQVRKSEESIMVLHGPWVETADTFFCDGAWAGEFSEGQFESCMLVGSAGKVTKEGLLVSAPNNTLECIYLCRTRNSILVSNSLVFLLAATQDNADTKCLFYLSWIVSIVDGLKEYVRSLPTRDGNLIERFYHCNLLVRPDLQVREEPKKPVKDFRDFGEYKSFLQDQVTAITANANDPHRQVQYKPITTISRGYDSPAVAALAKDVGCRDALTFRSARGLMGEDSGENIAEILGMQTKTFDRLDYLKEAGFIESENWGVPEPFAAWGEILQGRLLFTGFHGGNVWDRNLHVVGPDIIRRDASGNGLTEFRLRVGFIILPVAFLGCTSHSAIHRISNSAEMEPWSLMSNYDRPIPRRLLEEAGVPRGLFGTKKRAATVDLKEEDLKVVMRRESMEDFMRYASEHWDHYMIVKAMMTKLIGYIHKSNQFLNRQISNAFERWLGIYVKLPLFVPRRLRVLTYGYVGRESLLFHWAVEKLLPRYSVCNE